MITNTEEIQQRLARIGQLLQGVKRLIVLTHHNPDPDSVSSAVALAYLVQNKFNVPASVRFTGIVGRAENRAMIRLLKLKLSPLTEKDLRPGNEFALVDMQPKTGNSGFPKNRKPLMVFDHHPLRKTTKADLIDVRTEYGATVTMLAEYLLESGLEIPPALATAMSYGITSETQDLGRDATEQDRQAHQALFPIANKRALAQIEHPRLPRDFFVTLNRALHHSFVYKNAVSSTLGEIQNPDFVAFTADFLLRLERMNWSICIGRFKGKLIISIRTTRPHGRAGHFLRRLLGKRGTAGGHEMMAGGQVPCTQLDEEACAKLEEEIVREFLEKLGYRDAGQMTPLLAEESLRG